MKIQNVLTLSEVLKYCQRASGRTTNIIKALKTFLEDLSVENKHYVVIVCNEGMCRMYMNELKQAFSMSDKDIIFHSVDHKIMNIISNNKVTILSTNGSVTSWDWIQQLLKGIKVDDVIFDTPEINLFNHSCLKILT